MDTAKMAAALATNKGQVRDHLNPFEDKLVQQSLPKILLPTTAGTGSEASSDAVVIDPELGGKTFSRSPHIYPTAAIVDPTLTVSCPPKVTAGCGMDALSHVVEALISNDTNPLAVGMALEGIKQIFRSLRKAYHNGKDLAARWDVSFAAMIGGLMFGTAPSAYPGHAISEVIGPQHQIPHGTACGIVLPYIMDFNLSACTENLALMSRCLGFDTGNRSERELAGKAVDAVFQLMIDIEMPLSLSEVGISKNELPKYRDTYLTSKLYELKRYNPRVLTPQNVDALFEKMWRGIKS